jgi:energy-coupling factor transport system ATP-binding protein
VSDFTFRYWKGSPPALSDLTLRIRAGDVCAVLGPANAGKTTLLHALSGALGSHHRTGNVEGAITIGTDTYKPLPQTILFPRVALTLQDPYYQVSGLRDTVFQEISLTLETLGIPPPEALQRMTQVLDSLGIRHLAERKPSTLSGGELQRVALGTILVAQPEILLLDEPCNSLDTASTQKLASILCTLKGASTIVFTDVQLELALTTADQFVVLQDGHLFFVGSRSEFFDHLEDFTHLIPSRDLAGTLHAVRESRLGRLLSKKVAHT